MPTRLADLEGDPEEGLVDQLLEKQWVFEGLRVWLYDLLVADYPAHTTVARRQAHARQTALLYIWRRFIAMLTDPYANKNYKQVLGAYPRLVRRYGELQLFLACLTMVHGGLAHPTVKHIEAATRRSIEDFGLPADAAVTKEAVHAFRVLERIFDTRQHGMGQAHPSTQVLNSLADRAGWS